MMENNKNKTLVMMIIGISFLVLLVIGATYAYFSVGTSNLFGSNKMNAIAGDIGTVTIVNNQSSLALNLSDNNMERKNNDITYYATEDGTPSTSENIVTIATASVLGNGYYNCSYTLKVTKNSTKDMYDAFQNMSSKSDGQIVLNLNGTDYDFNTENLFDISYDGVINYLHEGKDAYITAYMYFANKKNIVQDDLVETDIKLNLTIDNFKCTAVNKAEQKYTPLELIASKPDNLSEEIVGGLYRYQGTKDDVGNNYICFGTSNVDTCKNNQNQYMYRIVGITEDGKMYLIKNDGLSENYMWHSSDDSSIKYPNSDIYYGLNGNSSTYGNIFIKKYINKSSRWYKLIEDTEWKYGELSMLNAYTLLSKDTYNDFVNSLYSIENGFSDTTTEKIGLINISDGLYSLEYSGTINDGFVNIKNSWMFLEGSLGRTLFDNLVAINSSDDNLSNHFISKIAEKPVQPVFYLKSDIEFIGSGTSSNPFVINMSDNNEASTLYWTIGDKFETITTDNATKEDDYNKLSVKYFIRETSEITDLCGIFNENMVCFNTLDYDIENDALGTINDVYSKLTSAGAKCTFNYSSQGYPIVCGETVVPDLSDRSTLNQMLFGATNEAIFMGDIFSNCKMTYEGISSCYAD